MADQYKPISGEIADLARNVTGWNETKKNYSATALTDRALAAIEAEGSGQQFIGGQQKAHGSNAQTPEKAADAAHGQVPFFTGASEKMLENRKKGPPQAMREHTGPMETAKAPVISGGEDHQGPAPRPMPPMDENGHPMTTKQAEAAKHGQKR